MQNNPLTSASEREIKWQKRHKGRHRFLRQEEECQGHSNRQKSFLRLTTNTSSNHFAGCTRAKEAKTLKKSIYNDCT
jgi:hypothetical protein